jgi:hypothetical protein
MPQKTNFNVPPYYDDFDALKNFYRVLFRPGYAVQARELTTLQSILQNQIESFGKNIFKQGDMVIPGQVSLNTNLNYVKLSSVSEVATNVSGNVIYQKYDIKQLIGQAITGKTSGVTAIVLSTQYATSTSADTLFVKYIGSGTSAENSTFLQGETLTTTLANNPTFVVGTDGSVLPTSITRIDGNTGLTLPSISSPAMGYASGVNIEEGIYFVNGTFVRNDSSLTIIDAYYNKPSCQVGFLINEQLITPEEDYTLYDNAAGYSNYTAPGAHRFKIELDVVTYTYNQITANNFIKLISILNGYVQKIITPIIPDTIQDALAKRTYDEIGDFVVDNFSVDVREYYQQNNNKGLFSLDSATGLVNGLSETKASAQFAVGIGPGKAYVKGYEVINKKTQYQFAEKARELLEKPENRIKISGLPSYNITNVYGTVPLNSEGTSLTAYPSVYLCNSFNDGSIGFNGNGSTSNNIFQQTINRRGQTFTSEQGIKTIYVKLGSGVIPSNGSFVSSPLYYVKTRGTSGTVNSVNVISFKAVTRTDIGYSGQILELTVLGNKSDLEKLFVEYDDGDTNQYRRLYTSDTSAKADAISSTTTGYYGYIIDYNDTITPVVGIAKPKDFSFIQSGTGFNSSVNKILSADSSSKIYNGLFSLSYFNPVFFTKIVVDTSIDTGFGNGQHIFGLTSNAYGVIENTSNGNYSLNNGGNLLFVNTLSGTFIPGETIIDESGNSLRIATENTISHFVVVNRGSSYPSTSNGVTLSINNTLFDSSAISVNVNSGNIYKVNILNRNLFNTQYNQTPSVTINASTGSGAIIFPVLFRNTVLTYTNQDVKSVYSSYNGNNFTADVDYSTNSFYSSKIITNNYSFIGTSGQKYLECSNFDGDATTDIKQGDLIQFTDSSNNLIRTVVQYATKPQGLLKSRIYLDSVLTNNVSNTIIKISAKVENAQTNLLIPTGSQYVQSIIKDITSSNVNYYIRRDFVITTSSNSNGIVTFVAQLGLGTQQFAQFNQNSFLVTVLSNGGSNIVSNGDILYINPNWVNIVNTKQISGLTTGTFNLNIPASFFGTVSDYNSLTLVLTATLQVSNAVERIKTLNKNKQIKINPSSNRIVILRGQDYNSQIQSIISYSDVFKINFVYEGTKTTLPTFDTLGNLVTGTDVTERFSFDDGQRDTFYDVSRLVLKPGYEVPTGILVVSFDYFDHSQGDFCTVDSYLHETGVDIGNIPYFNSSTLGKISLRDVIDFRPKVDSFSIISGYQDTSILSANDYCSFLGSGGVVTNTPASDINLNYTIQFNLYQYLDRIDSITINEAGDFSINYGTPSINPVPPQDIADAMTLYYLYIPSYTNTVADIKVIPVNNKRYTMRDIGKLEQRIERIEQYTQLSVLEQQALNTQIIDEFGFERIKTGFVVDNFENHSIGNLASVDYKCSIDSQQSVLRSKSYETSIDLKELYTTDALRNTNNYENNNGIVTLPYTELTFIKNSYATETLNPNPFDTSNGIYVGDAFLSPSIDQWYDRNETPIILNNDSSIYSIFFAKNIASEAFDSIFNAYLLNWIGTNRNFYNTNSLSTLSSTSSSASIVNASIASSSNISPQNNELALGTSATTIGNISVITDLNLYAKTKYIGFKINRMKPNTIVYTFVDGQNIGRWVIPDNVYTGVPGNSLTSFGNSVTTDANGNASGFILIPSGYPPVLSASYIDDSNLLSYDSSYQQCYLTVGTKTFRFTSDSKDRDSTSTLSEAKYYITGVLPLLPSSIDSTTPPFFTSNSGIQFIESSTSSPHPLTQTFKVQNTEGGLFITGIDLFFNQKSTNLPIRVYLTNVESGTPGKYIIPGTESLKLANSYIRVYTNGSTTLTIGEIVTGNKSGATGPLSSVIDSNNNTVAVSTNGTVTLQNTQIYTLVLNNNNGVSFLQKETLSTPSLILYNGKTSSTNPLIITVANDSGRITNLTLNSFGKNYQSATITIQSPNLVGGTTATGTVKVSNGKVYEVDLTSSGSGYTQIPSVIINGTGSGNNGAIIQAELTIDTPAVIMGVATDSSTNGNINSTTPTHFKFDYPVYLQNNTYYAFVVETDSNKYRLWTSKLGETDVVTNTIVTTQSLIGSVFRTQNVNNWIEDLSEDIKFTLYKASFNTAVTGNLYLINDELKYQLLNLNPLQTDTSQDTTATSTLFKNNNQIVKVYHPYHGFEETGLSIVNMKQAQTSNGISSDVLNGNYFTVNNAGADTYTINCGNQAGNSGFGGGYKILISNNKKYEKVYAQISCLNFNSTNINSSVVTTNIVPHDSNSNVYSSYSQTDYETTFLNQEQYFTNQKVICSRLNEVNNNISNSIKYQIQLTSSNANLSPVIDTRFASIKIVNNIIENSAGQENRFGKRNQIVQFYPVYSFAVNIINSFVPSIGQNVLGSISKAIGTVVQWNSSTGVLYVQVTSSNTFQANDSLSFQNVSSFTSVTGGTISSFGVTLYKPNFVVGSTITALSVTNTPYSNLISGTIVEWDSQNSILTLSNNKTPINGDYTSSNTTAPFARTTTNQVADIFRVGDVLTYQGIVSGQERFIQISKISYTNGVDYVPETFSSNSSSVAKYVTKEIVLQTPSTAIDVRLTANVFEVNDVLVFYKIKLANTQSNFDDLNWYAFNNYGESDIPVLPSAENFISGLYENQSSYQEYKYSISGLQEFTSYAIKIVMKASNPAFVPKTQNMRAIASY